MYLCSQQMIVFVLLFQMLGFLVNVFVKTSNYNNVDEHNAEVSKIDILDILWMLSAQSITPLASQSETILMDTHFDIEACPSNTLRHQTTP